MSPSFQKDPVKTVGVDYANSPVYMLSSLTKKIIPERGQYIFLKYFCSLQEE